MMRASIDGNAGVSNTPQVGSIPTPAALQYRALEAGRSAMTACANGYVASGLIPPPRVLHYVAMQAATNVLVREMARDVCREVVGRYVLDGDSISTPNPPSPVYIDDATGA